MKQFTFDQAVAALAKGDLVVFATETVFGLGADAGNDAAVAKIYAVKGRPKFNPLIVHVGHMAHAARLAVWNARAQALAEAFWPGPLTLVLPRREGAKVSPIVTAGARTIAVRCPGAAQARALAACLPQGIAAPSANKSGLLSPSRAEHVRLGDQPDLGILAGQEPTVGLESTVVDLSQPRAQILRHGGIVQRQIEAVIGQVQDPEVHLEDLSDEQVRSPGQLRRHYAPPIPLLLNRRSADPGQALLAFGPSVPPAPLVYNLSATGDLVAAAARLFEGLHVLSGSGADAIAAMPIPETGMGAAINDRLRRGAVP